MELYKTSAAVMKLSLLRNAAVLYDNWLAPISENLPEEATQSSLCAG